ncbi:MAG: HlyD family efflux transporter periplasmic adaptor subunit [Prolixibacteraceae bacterium]|jgi:membrane fusion protein (multidrug efflux system)|nr:HlyD family efflux transporter periplasmic adaptor subunit [Prolixibacteraceae bacterium]
MKRTIIIIISFAVIVAMAFGIMKYLVAQKEMPSMRKAPEIVRYVKTADVSYTDVSTEVVGKGRVVAVASVDIVAEGSGKIIEGDVALKTGQSFQKGDVLFSIYKDEVELALKARKSNFSTSLANLLPDVKIDFESDYTKMFSFFNLIDVEQDLPKFPKIESEQLRMFLASRNLLAEYYSIQKDELALKRYTVYAPFTGTYSSVSMEVGAYTNMGGRIGNAIRTDVVEVEVAVDAVDANFIKIGDNVEFDDRSKIEGKVVRISGFINESTQSRMVYVKISNKNNIPLPGQYLEATFFGKALENVMEIARNAVFNYNEVYTIENGRLKKQQIEVHKRNESTLLFDGLDENTVLVVQPLIGVNDGSKVSRLQDAPKKGEKQKKGKSAKPQMD